MPSGIPKNTYNKVCAICSTKFVANFGNAKYCSEKCKLEGADRKRAAKVSPIKICPICTKEFKTKTNQRYCSQDCRAKSQTAEFRVRNEIKVCPTCGIKFKPTVPQQQFCSKKCGSNQRVKDPFVVKDTEHASFAKGISDYLIANADLTSPLDIEIKISEYLSSLAEIPIVYSRNQMTSDLIQLLKSGNASVATHLRDLLGFDSAESGYIVNTINYKDL